MNRGSVLWFGVLLASATIVASCGGVINLPTPNILALSPSSVVAGSVTFTLTVNGTGFAPSSQILFNGSPRQTIFLSQTALTTQINPTDIPAPGTISVQVFTPSPGGGTSTSLTLTITPATAPVPQISSISPTTVYAESSSTLITVNGTNFVSSSIVTVNGANRQTTFQSPAKLEVSLQSSDLTTAGILQIAVLNPPAPHATPPGGGQSTAVPLNVINPAPTISSLSPATMIAGSTTTSTLTVSGKGLDSASEVFFSGSARPTTFASSTTLIAQLASTDLAAGGTYPVQIVNPAPGGGTSATLYFDVVPSTKGAGLPMLIDVSPSGAQANNGAGAQNISGPVMDSSGRYIAFSSLSNNLLVTTSTQTNPDTNGAADIFFRDDCLGATSLCKPRITLVSVGTGGYSANGASTEPAMSASGSVVAFTSLATDLVPGVNVDGVTPQIYAATTCAGVSAGCTPAINLISFATDGVNPANGAAGQPSVSADGRYVAFVSTATNLAAGATTGVQQIYLRDTCLHVAGSCTPTTVLVSAAPDGVTPADGASSAPVLVASNAGQFVTFASTATNLVSGSGGSEEIYRVGLCLGVSTGCTPSSALLISTPDGTAFADGASSEPAMSPDARYVAFASTASNLGAASGGVQEIYLRDTCQGAPSGCAPATSLVSVAADGSTPANGPSEYPSLGNSGQYVAFASQAGNLTTLNLNGVENIFIRNTCLGGLSSCTTATALASISTIGTPGNGASLDPVVSGLGHFVSFYSAASNLVNTDLNHSPDIFLASTTF